MSGYQVKEKYVVFDATKKYQIDIVEAEENQDCIAGEILKGTKNLLNIANLERNDKPTNPLGAPMVSSQGACAAYFHYSGLVEC